MALRELLAELFFKSNTAEVKKADSAISGLATRVRELGALITAGAILDKASDMLSTLTEQADSLEDTSQQLGVNRQELQRWGFAAKLQGAEMGDLTTAIRNVQKGIADNSPALRELGVSTKTATGETREAFDVMRDVGDAIAGIEDPSKRTKVALEVFGKAGTKMVPILNQGKEGLRQLLGEVDELGGGLSEGAIDALAEWGDQTDRLDMATLSLKSALASQLVPGLLKGISTVISFVKTLTQTKEGAAALQGGIRVLGIAAAGAGVIAIAPWIPFLTMVIAIGLVVEDFVSMLEGKKSVIGAAVDAMFGTGSAKAFSDTLKQVWQVIKDAPNVGEGLAKGFELLGNKLLDFFKTTLPEAIQKALDMLGDAVGGRGDALVTGDVVAGIKGAEAAASSAGLDPEARYSAVARAEEQGKLAGDLSAAAKSVNDFYEENFGKTANDPAATAQLQSDAFNMALAKLPKATELQFPEMFAAMREQTGLANDTLEAMFEAKRVETAVSLSRARDEIGQTAAETLPVQAQVARAEALVQRDVQANQTNNVNQTLNITIDGAGDPEEVAERVIGGQSEANRAALAGIKKVTVDAP